MKNYPDERAVLPGPNKSVDDLPLFDQPRARTSDPDTSHMAARKAQETAYVQRALILHTLKQYGPLTCDDVDAINGWRVGTTSRRMVELVRANSVRRLSKTKPTRTGQLAHTYQRFRGERS